jgi:polyisoprenoid-binding protein YceI
MRGMRGEAQVEVRDGQIQLDPAPTGYIEADVDLLKANNKLEDIALRKQIEAKKYPTVRYEVRGAEGGPEQFKVRGAFTFHGVTQEFMEEATARIQNGQLHVEAEHTFDIRDFGVQPFKLLNLQIHPNVTLKVRLVGQEQGGGGYAWG